MNRRTVLWSILGGAALVNAVAFAWRPSPVIFSHPEILRDASEEKSGLNLLSSGYRLDRIYRSMEGPGSAHPGLRLPKKSGARMIWLTGLDTDVVDANSRQPISAEFLCHANLTFDATVGSPDQYNRFFQEKTHLDWRLFSIVPGRFSIRLPEGFGVPIPADATLDYFTMSLNQNVRDHVVNVRMRSRVHAVPESDPAAPTKALFRKALYVLESRTVSAGNEPAPMPKGPVHVGAGCADFCSVNASAASTVGSLGNGKTLHWLVPPGAHTYRTEITEQLKLPFDTTIHYATFHIHPYGKFFELRDLTTGEVILHLNSRDLPDRLGVAQVDELKSVEGLPVIASHRYEVVVAYENPTERPIDAMGILYLYLLEKQFRPEFAGGNGQIGQIGQIGGSGDR